jgi:2-oxoglutarate ferredoxin oxidoreductase subunit gamma
MANTNIVFSGFGGQGMLSLGQVVATIATNQGRQASWIPSYGAEMRGGTANCSVIISDTIIGSPIITKNIDILVAMNGPSIDKFLPKVRPGGYVYYNSSVITTAPTAPGITFVPMDATNIATRLGNLKTQNIVMLAAFLKNSTLFGMEDIKLALEQKFGAKYAKLIPLNLQAVNLGLEAS